MQKAKVNVDTRLKEKIQKFLNQLEQWRKEQEFLALDELIWKLYLDTGYYNYVGLSIIFSKLIIVSISIVSKYSCVLSENTGKFFFTNSCSYIFALFFVERNNITISLV